MLNRDYPIIKRNKIMEWKFKTNLMMSTSFTRDCCMDVTPYLKGIYDALCSKLQHKGIYDALCSKLQSFNISFNH